MKPTWSSSPISAAAAGRARCRRTAIFAASAIMLAGCSFSIGGQSASEAGVEVIEGDLADVLGLGALDASCSEPDAEEAGETFSCSATTEAGDRIDVQGVVESDDEIFVAASNVVTADDLTTLEADAIGATAAEFDVDPSTLTVDCPDESVVLDRDALTCEITDASDGGRYELIVTFGDYVLKEGFASWDYSLGERLN